MSEGSTYWFSNPSEPTSPGSAPLRPSLRPLALVALPRVPADSTHSIDGTECVLDGLRPSARRGVYRSLLRASVEQIILHAELDCARCSPAAAPPSSTRFTTLVALLRRASQGNASGYRRVWGGDADRSELAVDTADYVRDCAWNIAEGSPAGDALRDGPLALLESLLDDGEAARAEGKAEGAGNDGAEAGSDRGCWGLLAALDGLVLECWRGAQPMVGVFPGLADAQLKTGVAGPATSSLASSTTGFSSRSRAPLFALTALPSQPQHGPAEDDDSPASDMFVLTVDVGTMDDVTAIDDVAAAVRSASSLTSVLLLGGSGSRSSRWVRALQPPRGLGKAALGERGRVLDLLTCDALPQALCLPVAVAGGAGGGGGGGLTASWQRVLRDVLARLSSVPEGVPDQSVASSATTAAAAAAVSGAGSGSGDDVGALCAVAFGAGGAGSNGLAESDGPAAASLRVAALNLLASLSLLSETISLRALLWVCGRVGAAAVSVRDALEFALDLPVVAVVEACATATAMGAPAHIAEALFLRAAAVSARSLRLRTDLRPSLARAAASLDVAVSIAGLKAWAEATSTSTSTSTSPLTGSSSWVSTAVSLLPPAPSMNTPPVVPASPAEGVCKTRILGLVSEAGRLHARRAAFALPSRTRVPPAPVSGASAAAASASADPGRAPSAMSGVELGPALRGVATRLQALARAFGVDLGDMVKAVTVAHPSLPVSGRPLTSYLAAASTSASASSAPSPSPHLPVMREVRSVVMETGRIAAFDAAALLPYSIIPASALASEGKVEPKGSPALASFSHLPARPTLAHVAQAAAALYRRGAYVVALTGSARHHGIAHANDIDLVAEVKSVGDVVGLAEMTVDVADCIGSGLQPTPLHSVLSASGCRLLSCSLGAPRGEVACDVLFVEQGFLSCSLSAGGTRGHTECGTEALTEPELFQVSVVARRFHSVVDRVTGELAPCPIASDGRDAATGSTADSQGRGPSARDHLLCGAVLACTKAGDVADAFAVLTISTASAALTGDGRAAAAPAQPVVDALARWRASVEKTLLACARAVTSPSPPFSLVGGSVVDAPLGDDASAEVAAFRSHVDPIAATLRQILSAPAGVPSEAVLRDASDRVIAASAAAFAQLFANSRGL